MSTGAVLVGAIVAAAGRGERMGAGPPKALRELCGEPLLLHAVRGLRAAADVGPIVVAAPADHVEAAREMLTPYDVTVVAGGPERHDSITLALAALPASVGLVLVHDAARCLTPVAVIEAVIGGLRGGAPAVIPVLPLTDTVKRVESGTETVLETVDRADLRAAQTPQGFERSLLQDLHETGSAGGTDDAVLAEARGLAVVTVPGSELALKVTGPFDLAVATAVLAGHVTVGAGGSRG